jgi:hypothetical protein
MQVRCGGPGATGAAYEFAFTYPYGIRGKDDILVVPLRPELRLLERFIDLFGVAVHVTIDIDVAVITDYVERLAVSGVGRFDAPDIAAYRRVDSGTYFSTGTDVDPGMKPVWPIFTKTAGKVDLPFYGPIYLRPTLLAKQKQRKQ